MQACRNGDIHEPQREHIKAQTQNRAANLCTTVSQHIEAPHRNICLCPECRRNRACVSLQGTQVHPWGAQAHTAPVGTKRESEHPRPRLRLQTCRHAALRERLKADASARAANT